MKVIVDIKNKTLKMLENDRAVFKGEYSADKLELYINQQLENEYPVITGLLSNGRRIGAFTTDDGYEIETIDGVEYTKAKFTLSKENGFPLSAGVTQITIWMYRTKDSVLVSKEAIGNVVFTVVDTTSFNDGDIIISGDVEGTVVNLKVEVENLQSRLEQYLPLSGAKKMTGDLDMDGNDIKNTRLYDNETHNSIALSGLEDGALSFSSKKGIFELRSPEMNDLDMANFLIYPTPENTNHIEGSYEVYEWNLPKESGTVVVRDDAGGVKSITRIIDPYNNNGIVFGLLNDETTLYNPDSTIGLSSTDMIGEGDIIHSLKFPDTSDGTGDGSWKTYTWDLPKQSGTIALLNDFTKDRLIETIGNATQSLAGLMSENDKKHLDTLVNLLEEDNDNVVNTINEILAIFNQYPEGAEILSVLNEKLNKSELLPIIEENAEKTSTLDIGTSATFNPESDEQIPTSKAVAGLMASAGGSGVIANGVYDDYAEPLERIEIDGKKYTTLNKKKVEYVTAHFEEGEFSHDLQDIADSSLPVFITNLTSGIEFELRHVYYNNRGYFVFIADGDLMNSIADYFDSLGIGGCYEKDINYLTFIENTCCGEGDELKIEYYNHQSSVYYEV